MSGNGKRIVSVCVALILLLLCGCGTVPPTEEENLPELIIGSDIYAPYFYIGDDGTFTGIDVEIATEACRRLGYKAVFRQIQWQNKDEYLENGTVDCLWGSFSMNGREDLYAWAGPYMYSRQIVVVHAESDIFTLSDLNGKRISVQSGSKPEELLLNHLIPEIGSVKAVYSFTTLDLVFSALRKGYVDACAGHETAYKKYMEDMPENYRILEESLLKARLGVAFYLRTGEGKAAEFAQILEQMKDDGSIARIISEYGLNPADYLTE